MRKLQDIHAERAKADADDRDTRSRSDARTQRLTAADRLMTLGRTLCELPEKQLRALDLPELLADVVADARRIDSPPAFNRQLKLVRRELGAVDVEAVEQRLDEVLHPGRGPMPQRIDPAFDLYERLRQQGDAAIHALCLEHSDLDRNQLRALIRAAEKQRKDSPDKPPAKLPAVRKLLDRLRRYATA